MAKISRYLRLALLTALVGLFGLFGLASTAAARPSQSLRALPSVALADLPPEARHTLRLIRQGGPFPYPRNDGVTFGNFERRLPWQPRGYYREYTVRTPGSRDRGPRRIVAGEGRHGEVSTSGEYYYSDDHYRSFRRIHEEP